MVGSTEVSYEQAGELKIGQVGVANLRVRVLDVPKLVDEMQQRVSRAPKLFGRTALIIDFSELVQLPDVAMAQVLLDGLRKVGVFPIALAYGTTEVEALSEQLGLPLLAKFRAQYEPEQSRATRPATRAPAAQPQPAVAPVISQPGQIHKGTIRSGQQIYAQNSDLTVLSTVGPGAEVIADGSIHVYGALRGRALAGVQDNSQARIFCLDFQAELVAIAGHYMVLDDFPDTIRGKPVQIWLEEDQIKMAALN